MHSEDFSIVRNSFFNFIGWVIPSIVNFLCVPIIVRGLGYNQYGVWTVVMAVMGYFTLLDLGMVTGGIRHLAEYRGKGDIDKVNQVIGLGLAFYAVIGLAGSILLAISVDTFLLQTVKIPAGLVGLARRVLYMAAFGFFAHMLQTYLLSVPKALHRFDISNTIESASTIAVNLGTILLLFLGYGLQAIIVTRIVINVISCVLLFIIITKIVPHFKLTLKINRDLKIQIFSYSLTSFLGNLGSSTVSYLQTIIIGSILGVSAVTIFSIPFQLVSRVMNISYRLASVIFPISSELGGGTGLERLHRVYSEMTRFIFFFNTALATIFILFSWDILYLWMGRRFADEASGCLFFIAVGAFFDLATSLPSLVNDGISSPRLTSTFAFVRGLVGGLFGFIGAKYWGVQGACVAFMIAAILLSSGFIVYVHQKIIRLSLTSLIREACAGSLLFGAAVVVSINGAGWLLNYGARSHLFFLVEFLAVSLAFAAFGYLKILDDKARRLVLEKCSCVLRRALPGTR